ncbi:hypothetical protein [Clostridium botulinum]|uniref:hypothetical protein n=1 Tax=Clostridium botulinum TaxID=1491 RepID=UPI0007746311|nr:hypothetical protein [Clostridium botulinum]
MKHKKIGIFIIVLIFSIFLEVFCFNFNVFYSKLAKLQTTTYNMKDSELYNWSKTQDGIISNNDPNIVIQDIDYELRNIAIIPETNQTIPYVEVFYTLENKDEPLIPEHKITDNDKFNKIKIINIGKKVNSIRIDLGDDAGLELKDFKIITNYYVFKINIWRIIFINIIFWGLKLLFALQKPPKYNI